jgi:DNA-binding phage protein
MVRKTAFDRYVDKQLKKPGTRAAYDEARAEIDAVDRLVRALDAMRIAAGVSKADLARSISAKPEIVRRLFTSHGSNPTLATFAKLAAALGQRIALVPVKPKPATALTARKSSRAETADA